MKMLLLSLVTALTLCVPHQTARGQCENGNYQDYWVLSANRSWHCNSDESVSPIIYKRPDMEGKWEQVEEQEFLASELPDVPTIFFVHGNPTPGYRAHQMARRISRYLHERADGKPFRLVLWYWPDDRRMNRRTAQIEASRSDYQAYYLARCVQQMKPDTKRTLIGYSFGARVVGGTLELLAGGCIAGRRLEDAPVEMPPTRVAMLGAAFDAHWLGPGQRFGQALDMCERILITINPLDPAMKFFGLVYRGRGPQALGRYGPTCLGPNDKVEIVNVACWVGKQHDWQRYLSAPGFLCRLAWYAYLEDEAEEAVAQTVGAAGL